MARFERPQRIRFAHCDPAGIVFFPQYFVLFNGLVEDWVSDALGIRYAGLITERRIGLPIVKLDCEFTAVSRLGDEVTLALAVQRIGRSSLTLQLECSGPADLRLRMTQVLVTTNLDTHRAVALPDDLRAAMLRFEHAD
ncbi:MAG: acyl-CoA thioesterase [Pseudomonadota bacterium]|nr:acyl-CoA thioesterase [Pseudomonadota bacterium]